MMHENEVKTDAEQVRRLVAQDVVLSEKS